MTATAYNRSQKSWGRRPHFPINWIIITIIKQVPSAEDIMHDDPQQPWQSWNF